MPLLLIAPPALIEQAPAAPRAFDHLQELLEAIPEAMIIGKRGAMRGLVAKAKAGWDRTKPEISKAMPEPEVIFIDRQLKAMQTMKPREQAVGALGISGTLSRFQPRSRQQDLLQADRTVMLAWCTVDGGQVERLPGVVEAFKPLMDQDKGQHTLAMISVQEALKRLQESQQKRHAAGAKKALKDLLDLVDVLEKP